MPDIRRDVEYLSEDHQASQKIGLGAMLSLAPFLNLAAIGYQVELARRVSRRDPRPLPECKDLGRLRVPGAKLGLANFIYGLPILLIILSGMVIVFVGFLFSVQSESARWSVKPGPPPPLVFALLLSLIASASVYGLFRPAILAECARRGTLQA